MQLRTHSYTYMKLSIWQYHLIVKGSNTYSTAQFKLYTCVQVHACVCTLTRAKLQKLVCAPTVARDFGHAG